MADGKFVVPSRDGSSLFQETYPALDSVSALAHLPVETGRTSSGRAAAEAVSGLVTARSARTWSGRTRGRPPPTPGTRMRSMTLANNGASARRPTVITVARTWKEGVHGEVEPGGQATARAANRMVVRLGRQPVRTRPARLDSPPFAGPAAC
jgi:hypothetical protein